jgi:hypothetical protein
MIQVLLALIATVVPLATVLVGRRSAELLAGSVPRTTVHDVLEAGAPAVTS